MVKIKSVWSFRNAVTVELADGTGYIFFKGEVDTKEKLLQKLKDLRGEVRMRKEAREKGLIDGSLKHLKELEGAEVE